MLIYAKNGHRPQLLEHLAELYPRHIQIHYGQYKREQLFDAARRSRACAYLADDDHGPLALQEILLSGCPTVGVKTGAPFIESARTGFLDQRLPPGVSNCADENDKLCLETFINRLRQVMKIDRSVTQLISQNVFRIEPIVDCLVENLQSVR